MATDPAPQAVTGDHEQRPVPRVRKVTFPWASVIAGLLAAAYLVIATEPQLAAFYDLAPGARERAVKYGVLAALVLAVALDLWRYRRERARQGADLLRVRARIDDLWQRNKQLQLKAHTYAEHADKLKYFISDKLLESIEYDEKFLHFKGIAAEVRHNGVISFDKVQTALQRAAAAEQGGDETAGDGAGAGDYRAALEALHYLWDLLDLSTAENLTLHIGNLLCEYEEQYCQRLLAEGEADEPPAEPTFDPQRAVWRALAMVRPEPLPEPDAGASYMLDDGQVYVRLEPVSPLLGKENHLVLLAENLLRNAQFYAGKRGYGAAFAPIAVILDEQDGEARLRVYNRGPPVPEADREQLFQLGYSTRRKREHHGRGLGLYFVNEIVKGYEGRIRVQNIAPPVGPYSLRLELQNGETREHSLAVETDRGRPYCVDAAGASASAGWRLASPLRRAVVAGPDADEARVVEGFAGKGRQELFDPAHPERPHWRLRYRPKRNAHRLDFEPLRIGGVEFEVRLPTAQKRVESVATDPEAPGLDPDLEAIERRGEASTAIPRDAGSR